MNAAAPTLVLLTGGDDQGAEAAAFAATGRPCEVLTLRAAGLFEDIASLADRRGRVVAVNLVRRVGGDPRNAPLVPGLLALRGVPFVGSPSAAVTCGIDRRITKAVLFAAGIPTPGGRVFRAAPQIESVRDMAFPLVVKPVREGAGGPTAAPLFAAAPEELCQAVARLLEESGQPVLGEVYLEGRQFRMAVTGEGRASRALPAVELDVAPGSGQAQRFLHHAAGGRFKCPAEVGEHIKVSLGTAAVAAYRALECRDLAFVTLRLDARDKAHVLSVDPLPNLSPGEELSRAVEASGEQWSDFLSRLVEAAESRP